MTLFGIAWIVLSATAEGTAPAVLKQEIVVTAAREEQPRDQAAAAVTVLDRDEIEQLPATSLAEVLSFVPGVTMFFDGGSSGLPTVTSRGFFGGGEVEYVKLIVDGIPVGDAESGNVDWQRFRAADIDRIEVLHGPGSALYGDTALGGVIQVFTRGASGDAGGEVRAGAGSFGASDLHASYHADVREGLRVDASAGRWETGGFRDNADADGWLAHVALERLSDDARWRFDAGADRQHRQQPGPLTRDEIAADREQSSALFDFDGQTTSRKRLGATFDSFGATAVRASLYGIQRDDDNLRTLLLAPGFGTSAFRALATRVGGGTLEASREWTRSVLRAGADLERASIDARYEAVSEEGSRNRIGLFVTGGWNVGARMRLTAGLRRDDVRDDVEWRRDAARPAGETPAFRSAGVSPPDAARRRSSAWSPRAGLNIHLGPTASPIALFVQVSRAFKAPTLDQLFDPRPYPDGTGGTFTISNPNLRPQRALNAEAGLSRETATSDWSLVAYRMNVRDEIDFDPQTFTYRNIGSSRHRGVEASARVMKTARITPQLTYAWTRVVDSAMPDRQLKNIPEHTAQFALHTRISDKTRFDAVYRWRSEFTLDDEATSRTPSMGRVDLRLARDIGKLRIEADVLNALDEQYNELGYVLVDFTGQLVSLEFPAPGRALRLGLAWSFN